MSMPCSLNSTLKSGKYYGKIIYHLTSEWPYTILIISVDNNVFLYLFRKHGIHKKLKKRYSPGIAQEELNSMLCDDLGGGWGRWWREGSRGSGYIYAWVLAELLQSCPTVCNPWTPWNAPGKNTGVDCHALLQGIFLTQGLNPCFLCLLY